MANDLMTFKNAGLPVTDIGAFSRALATAQGSIQVGGGENFLKLDKRDGEWRYGASETDVQVGSHWAINPASLKMGYMCWGKGEVLGKQLRSILTSAPVQRGDLPDMGAPWMETVAFQLKCCDGEDAGTTVEYEQTSYGSKKAFNDLLTAFQAQITVDQVNIVPVVQMKSDSYEHKQYGRIFNPIFEIHRWMSMSGEVAKAHGSEEEEAPEPLATAAAPAASAKARRAPVGGGAEAPAANAEKVAAVAAEKPAVVRQRRRPVSA
jgi:hypothetical protein